MWTAVKEIKKAVVRLRIGHDRFRRLDKRREHKVLQDVKRHFLTQVNPTFWWESFRYESDGRTLEETHRRLPALCPNDGKKIWFIPCENEEAVYDTFPEVVPSILAECPPFEYAVVDKKLEWMFLENHHNVMCATGVKAILRLREVHET